MIQVVLSVLNKKGLHARAAAKFVKIVECCDAQVRVVKEGDDTEVTGSSILGLMMLGAEQGSALRVTAEGKDAEKAVKELQELLTNKFGEPE